MKSFSLLEGMRKAGILAVFMLGMTAISPVLHAAPKAEASVETQQNPVININKATLEELQLVRGIGPVLAQRIMEYREQQGGRFEKADDLANVKGIGKAKYEKIKNQVSI